MNRRLPLTVLSWLSGGLASLGILTVVVAPGAGAAENATRPRLLVDFRDTRAVKLHPVQAQTIQAPWDGGHVQEVFNAPFFKASKRGWPGRLERHQ